MSLRTWLHSLSDNRSIPSAIVTTVFTAGLTLVNPQRLGVRGRLIFRSAISALGGWYTWTTLRSDSVAGLPIVRTAFSVGVTGATMGVCEATEALDARIHNALVRAGVRRPRLALTALSVVLTLSVWWLDRHTTDQEHTDDETEPAEEIVELPVEVRAIAERLLGATEAHGAAALRAQLAAAKGVAYQGWNDGEFWPSMGFSVPGEAPLAVPRDFRFPVFARYRPLNGRTFDVYLMASNGLLSDFAISEGEDWEAEDIEEWLNSGHGIHELTQWPDVDELELLIETPEGIYPLD